MNFNDFLIDYCNTTRSLTEWYVSNNSIILDKLHIFFAVLFDITLVSTIILTSTYLLIAIYRILFIKDKSELKFVSQKAPSITVQIPTRNELAAINCATRVLNSDYPKEKLQILIGDDSNIASVSAQLDAFALKNSKYVQIIRRTQNIGFKPGNLNNMNLYSTGDVIVIFDSDFLPKQDFLKRLVTPFIYNKNLAGVQSRWKPINSNSNMSSILASSINNMFHHIFLPFMYSVSNSVCFCGSAEAVNRKTLMENGGWLSGSLTEDIEYSMRLWSKNEKISYIHTLTCDMEVPFSSRDLFRQQMRWAFGVICAARLHLWRICSRAKKGLLTDTALLISGYVLTGLLLSLSVFGLLSIITHAPEPIQWFYFIMDVIKNVLLTSGILITYVLAEVLAKEYWKIPKVIVASLSIGLIVTLYVNKGIFDALTNKGMKWYLLKKTGNNIRA